MTLQATRTPTPTPPPPPTKTHRLRWLGVVVLALVIAAGAFTAVQLTRASSPFTAAQLSTELGCTQSPGIGDQARGHAGVQGFYCVGDINNGPSSDFAYFDLFPSVGVATMNRITFQPSNAAATGALLEPNRSQFSLRYVYSDLWAVWGTDSAVIAAAVNAGGTELM